MVGSVAGRPRVVRDAEPPPGPSAELIALGEWAHAGLTRSHQHARDPPAHRAADMTGPARDPAGPASADTSVPATPPGGRAADPPAQDWRAWHDEYDVPGSQLARRLAAVQEQIRVALDSSPPGPLRVVSICAGQGRDLLGVLATHPRGRDVTARLVELDPRNAAIARDAAHAAGLGGVGVVVGDASL